ncbi:MAG: deoxyguanosinetriphosphate triphosphohydrolase [Nitrospirota bacterium]
MNIRRQTEQIEDRTLHPRACRSAQSRGRQRPERQGDLRTCFQHDRDRVIHSKAFRRLKRKTQVFLAPRGDHYRTRLTHVLEVSQIARTIARALRLNEDLTEAIALAHDLGHTPFGHAGEAVLRDIHPGGFEHYQQSLRVVDFLERDGKGLNLTEEVRDGIIKHSKGGKGSILSKSPGVRALTLEAEVVRVSDIIAYLNHDLDDARRAGVLRPSDVPRDVRSALGSSHSKRIDTMVRDLVGKSLEADLAELRMSKEVMEATHALRDFLWQRVYEGERTKKEFVKARKLLTDLYGYYMEHPGEVFRNIPAEKKPNKQRSVCDFIAGMTDHYAIMTYERLFMPQDWMVM